MQAGLRKAAGGQDRRQKGGRRHSGAGLRWASGKAIEMGLGR